MAVAAGSDSRTAVRPVGTGRTHLPSKDGRGWGGELAPGCGNDELETEDGTTTVEILRGVVVVMEIVVVGTWMCDGATRICDEAGYLLVGRDGSVGGIGCCWHR